MKNGTVLQFGFWSALTAFIGTAGFSIAQVLQVAGLLHPPLDEILIYGFSLLIAPPFMLAFLALHHITPDEKKIWSHAAVLFSAMYVVYVALNYVVQLTAVIPKPDANPVLVQSPHSLFWTVDALGYISLGLATLFAVPVFRKEGMQNRVRWFFFANGLVTPLIALVYFYPRYSTALLLMASPWAITALGSTLTLAVMFRNPSA